MCCILKRMCSLSSSNSSRLSILILLSLEVGGEDVVDLPVEIGPKVLLDLVHDQVIEVLRDGNGFLNHWFLHKKGIIPNSIYEKPGKMGMIPSKILC